jgi:hypothetical protein
MNEARSRESVAGPETSEGSQMHTASIARSRATQARNSIAVIERSWTQVFADQSRPFPRDDFAERVARHFMQRPPRCVSREFAAVHESGQFVMMHMEGLGAWSAEIFQHHRGWRGQTRPANAPCLTDPRQLLGEARVMVAGPIAVELLGDEVRGAADNLEEILKARFYCARAAELSGRKKGPLWRSTLIEAAQRVEFSAQEIRELSAILAQQTNIYEFKPQVRAVLRRIDRAKPADFPPLSQRSVCVLANIDAALCEFSK